MLSSISYYSPSTLYANQQIDDLVADAAIPCPNCLNGVKPNLSDASAGRALHRPCAPDAKPTPNFYCIGLGRDISLCNHTDGEQ